MQYTIFHWGLHPWALYAVFGLALAHTSFRKGRPNRLSAIALPNRPGVTPPGAPSIRSPFSSPFSVLRPPWGLARCGSTAV
ncbi:MAG: BCCT family transporter [Ornithinimicrobium sp.]